MKMRFKVFFLILFLCLCLMQACSPGVHVKMQSSAPAHSLVFIGMNRSEAENHLGSPLFISRLDEERYRGIYEYESEPSGLDIFSYDMLDITTLGLGKLIISPVDRVKTGYHLMAVIYQMEDEFISNDRVISIKDRIRKKTLKRIFIDRLSS